MIFLSCEERVFDNPNDSNTELEPNAWSPTELVISRTGSNSLDISWKHEFETIEGFKIDRKINNGDWTIAFVTLNKAQREWTDSTAVADNNKVYYYRLYAYSGKNESSKITVQFQDVAPANVNVTSVDYDLTEMVVTWQRYTDADFVSYKLFYSTSLNGTQTVMDTITNINSNTYTINAFDPTIENWFWVKVINEFGLVSVGGSGRSNPIDNPPYPVDVLMVDYDFDQMTVMWELSTDIDFKSYLLQRSDEEAGPYWNVELIDDKTTTFFSTTDYDPTVENWYWIKVTDFWDQETIGYPLSNNSDPPPNSVDVISVTYDTLEMVIEWEEYVPNTQRIYAMSISHAEVMVSSSTVPDNDFVSYELLRSDTEDGQYESISVIEDISTTSHSITEYDPTIENWFKIRVTDYWELTSIGSPMTNQIHVAPDPIDITSVTYDIEQMIVNWEQSISTHFSSYELFRFDTLENDYTSVTLIEEISSTFFSLTEFNPTVVNLFMIRVTDYWGLSSDGLPMSNQIDSPPTQSDIVSVTYYDTSELMTINWEVNLDSDFDYYMLLSASSQFDIYTPVTVIFEQFTTSYLSGDYDPTEEIWFKLRVTDYWGLLTDSEELQYEPPVVYTFLETYGGDDNERAHSLLQTDDNGYLMIGHSGSNDVWMIKTNELGIQEWYQTFGGESVDDGWSIQQTSDGGYAIIGYTYSYDIGNSDVWLIKTDYNGNEEWTQTFGGSNVDRGRSIQQTSDGGYAICGYTSSYGSGVYDGYLIKANSYGDEQWDQTFGGSDYDYFMEILQTIDGGYIMVGATYSYGSGGSDIWLVSTDQNGNEEWSRTIGGVNNDWGNSIKETTDGGYIICGRKNYTMCLIKTDEFGNEQWDQTFGPTGQGSAYDVRQTNDGGYIFVGSAGSYGYYDCWLVKTDANGNQEWIQVFGGEADDWGWSVKETTDGGYVITGFTTSYGNGGEDVWLIKTDSEGNLETMDNLQEIPNKTHTRQNSMRERSVFTNPEGINMYPHVVE